MMLALKSTPRRSGPFLHRLESTLVRWRLCSQWCHAGVVIGPVLYQANRENGLHKTDDWTPENWTLIDVGDSRDTDALALFEMRQGAAYNWLGVLGFVLPWLRGNGRTLYCFEWCAQVMGIKPARLYTPEILLASTVAEVAL